MSVIHGAMQDYALTLDKLLEHGAKWNPDAEVVTARPLDDTRATALQQQLAAATGRTVAMSRRVGMRVG